MFGWWEVRFAPPGRPEQSERAGDEENPAPVCVDKDQRDQRRRDYGSYGSASVDDAHGGGAFVDWEPFGYGAGGRGEAAALAHA